MSPEKWKRELKKIAKKYGGSYEKPKRGHPRIVLPNGRFVVTTSTPGDHRAKKNLEAHIRKTLNATDTD